MKNFNNLEEFIEADEKREILNIFRNYLDKHPNVLDDKNSDRYLNLFNIFLSCIIFKCLEEKVIKWNNDDYIKFFDGFNKILFYIHKNDNLNTILDKLKYYFVEDYNKIIEDNGEFCFYLKYTRTDLLPKIIDNGKQLEKKYTFYEDTIKINFIYNKNKIKYCEDSFEITMESKKLLDNGNDYDF